MLGTLIDKNEFSRDKVKAAMAQAPPVPADDLAFIVSNADLIRDDYAAAALEVIDATDYGKKQRIQRYGVGAAVGLAVGIVGTLIARSL